jgi:regulator of cell morphogenesis and NO signaling
LMPRVLGAHAEAHPFLRELDVALRALEHDLADHMIREERVLFPWLRRLEQPGAVTIGPPWSVQRPIDCMEHDHDGVAEAFVRIRALTDDYTPPKAACASFAALLTLLSDLERDTRRHIHKENNILFPAGLRAERSRAAIGVGATSGAVDAR